MREDRFKSLDEKLKNVVCSCNLDDRIPTFTKEINF